LEQTFGRYRLLDRLGAGGMAEVFKAKSFGVEGFEKVLVIKRILPKLAAQPKFVDMFVHEAKLAVRLSHANIVQVFDLGRVDPPAGESPSYFIAMEYVPGLDLASALSHARRAKIAIPFGMAVFVASEIAKALDHAHRRRDEQGRPLGIVHRDISPQNILVSWEGEVKVTDFGIAKAKDMISTQDASTSRTGRIQGKLAYMSPEQALGEQVDGRSDLYSLGTVLYQLIAGSNPFVAPTAFETLRRLQASEYPPLELLRPDTPKPLIDIVKRMLARRPEDRFADAGRLHEQLLGYFYASGERFGANNLAEFLEPLHEAASPPEIQGKDVLGDEHAGAANERTPVEVPQPAGSLGRTGSLSRPERTEGTGQLSRTVDIGERREVTGLVLADHTAAEPGASMARTREVLARYGARIQEEEPSQMVALFGLGDADGRDTEAAVRAALIILRQRGGDELSAGIHVGRILVDAQGIPIQDERLVSLIASAQALSRATDGQVAVSSIAARVIRGRFATADLPGAGRTAPEGGKVVTSARPPAAEYGRFVGRHDELKRLGDVLAAATRRRAQVVTILGNKGIGKTRLIAEMERRLAKGNYKVGFYVASCPRNGADVAWSGLTSMLQVLCGIQEGDDEKRILEVAPRLRALGLHDDESFAVLSQLGAVVERRQNTRPPGIPAAGLRTAFAKMVQSLCEDRLQCFCWDDAQGMDSSTIEAILSSTSRPGGLRAVFLLATRDTPNPQLAAHPYHHALMLNPLSDDDSAHLLASRVEARVIPPELLDFCRERAGGHPLFLEELVKELTESGAINVLSGVVKLRLEGAPTIPRTLRTLIAARVSRLESSDRAIMQAAAILGEPIPVDVLAKLLNRNFAQVDRAIAGLSSRDFLRVTGPAQASFASPMHGEIVLDAIPPEARREIHAAAAEAYIAVFGEEGGGDHGEQIAQHLYQAGDRDRAATFYARAALHKVRLNQLDPALRLMGRALDLADLDQRATSELALWIRVLADAVSRIRLAPDLPSVLAPAVKRIDTLGTLEEKVIARVDVARALGSVNLFDQAYIQLEEAFQMAGERDDLRRQALTAETEMASRAGDFVRCVRAADAIEAMGNVGEPRALLAIASARAATGDSVAALLALNQAESLSDPGDLSAASEREKQRVLVYFYLRDFRAAVDAARRAVDISRLAGLQYETAISLHNLGDAAQHLGELPRAYASFTESNELAEPAGHERLVYLNRMHLSFLDGLSGVADTAPFLRDCVRYADSRGYWTDALESRYLLGCLLKHRGERNEAKHELQEVVKLALAYGNKLVADDAQEALSGLS
jgi:serine/threonine protein kinase/tetratricopeptide (TPR) repeat protein